MTGYVRVDTGNNIADGNVINATDLDNEFDGVQAAFNSSTGHVHDGTTGNGAPITKIGPVQDVIVSISTMYPKTTNTVDLGTSSLKYKDLFLAGNASVAGTLAVTGVATFTAQPILSSLTASRAVFSDGSKGLISNAITGTGDVVMSNSPTLVTPALGTPASGTVTNLTGTASININGTVGATTPYTGAFTTLTTSSTVTHNGGTANGVAYLNGSKVLTTGSALTFDGTNLGVGTASPQSYGAGATSATIDATTVSGIDLRVGGVRYGRIYASTSALNIDTWIGTGPITFGINTNEQMRLTSTGLGIGTSSPSYKIDLLGGGVGSNAIQALAQLRSASDALNNGVEILFTPIISGQTRTAIGGVREGATANAALYFATNNAERMRLDSSGNLGLGVTPSAWLSSYRAMQFTGGSVQGGTAGLLELYANNFRNSNGDFIYSTTNAAARYALADAHRWYTAPSGTAGNAISFTQAMTLDASGRLGIGTTSPVYPLDVQSAAAAGFVVQAITNTNSTGFSRQLFQVGASGANGIADISYAPGIFFAMGPSTNDTTTPIVFRNNNATERMRLDSSGNLLVGTTSSDGYRLKTEGSFPFLSKATGGASLTSMSLWNNATTGDNIFVVFSTETNGTTRGSITYNRGAGLVAYNVTSDYRAKDIIGSVTDSGALIDAVPVYMGKMKGATQERPMFIAHEVPAYAHTGEKDAIDADGNPVYQQMDASALVPVMWAEIQSLRQRLAAAGI